MKIQPRDIASFLKAPSPSFYGAFFFGPEEGLVAERAQELAKLIVPNLSDVFLCVHISSESLKEHPYLLYDEMSSYSFTGERKVIRVKQATEAIHEALHNLIKQSVSYDHFLIIEAGDLDKRSKIRALSEKVNPIASIASYEESPAIVTQTLKKVLQDEGYQIDRDALLYLILHLTNNRMILRREIEKLICFMAGESAKMITLDHVQNIITTQQNDLIDLPIWMATEGQFQKMDQALLQLNQLGIMPIQVIRSGLRHLQRLYQVISQMQQGISMKEAMSTLSPPVFFKQEQQFMTQLRKWNAPQLERAMNELQECEMKCKTSLFPVESGLSRTFYRLCGMAGRN